MNRKKILWLCSWYPDKNEAFNGDFVQRHARAAALHNDIFVIHVAVDSEKKELKAGGEFPGLNEQVIYYKPTGGLFARWRNYNRWNKAYNKAINSFIKSQGRPDLVHVHVPYRDGLLAMKLKRMFGIPYVVTEHWTIYQPQNLKNYTEQPAMLRSLIYWIVRKSNLLLPVSRDLGELINKLVTPKEFIVVENVANTDHFYFNSSHQNGNGFRFLHVSNFNFQKNAEALVECFILFAQNFPDAVLVLVGQLPPAIKDRVESTGLIDKRIFLKGEISYPEVAKQMQEADALVMFSRYENSPCTIIEALCCGLPVISTRVGGIPELIDDTNGMLVDPGDENGLLSAMETIIRTPGSFDRASISSKAMNRFSYPVVGKKLDEIYTKVLNEKT